MDKKDIIDEIIEFNLMNNDKDIDDIIKNIKDNVDIIVNDRITSKLNIKCVLSHNMTRCNLCKECFDIIGYTSIQDKIECEETSKVIKSQYKEYYNSI